MLRLPLSLQTQRPRGDSQPEPLFFPLGNQPCRGSRKPSERSGYQPAFFPDRLGASRMRSPERPFSPEPLHRNPEARLKVRGRRRAMPRRYPRTPSRHHPVQGRAVLPDKHSPRFLVGCCGFFFSFWVCGFFIIIIYFVLVFF